eukprot:365717-Chlamydomonas_euryale.AAC.16
MCASRCRSDSLARPRPGLPCGDSDAPRAAARAAGAAAAPTVDAADLGTLGAPIAGSATLGIPL